MVASPLRRGKKSAGCENRKKDRRSRVPSWHRMIPGEKSIKVSIIVVNWNGERFLKDCLGALSNQSYANCEIILVDNGSADNSVRFTRENFPR